MATKPASQEVCEHFLKGLRLQRHEFMNHIQVIYALLQLGRVEKALFYIDDIAKNPEMLSSSMNMSECPAACQHKNPVGD